MLGYTASTETVEEKQYGEGIRGTDPRRGHDRCRGTSRVRARGGPRRTSVDARELPGVSRARASRRPHAQPARARRPCPAHLGDDERAARPARARRGHLASPRSRERSQRHGDPHGARAAARPGGAADVPRSSRAAGVRALARRQDRARRARSDLAGVLRAGRAPGTAPRRRRGSVGSGRAHAPGRRDSPTSTAC